MSNCGDINDWVVVQPNDDINKKSTVVDTLESDHYCIKSHFKILVSTPSTTYRTVSNMANIEHSSFIAKL